MDTAPLASGSPFGPALEQGGMLCGKDALDPFLLSMDVSYNLPLFKSLELRNYRLLVDYDDSLSPRSSFASNLGYNYL